MFLSKPLNAARYYGVWPIRYSQALRALASVLAHKATVLALSVGKKMAQTRISPHTM